MRTHELCLLCCSGHTSSSKHATHSCMYRCIYTTYIQEVLCLHEIQALLSYFNDGHFAKVSQRGLFRVSTYMYRENREDKRKKNASTDVPCLRALNRMDGPCQSSSHHIPIYTLSHIHLDPSFIATSPGTLLIDRPQPLSGEGPDSVEGPGGAGLHQALFQVSRSVDRSVD